MNTVKLNCGRVLYIRVCPACANWHAAESLQNCINKFPVFTVYIGPVFRLYLPSTGNIRTYFTWLHHVIKIKLKWKNAFAPPPFSFLDSACGPKIMKGIKMTKVLFICCQLRWNPQLKWSYMITQSNPGYTLGFQNLGYFWQIIFVFHQH